MTIVRRAARWMLNAVATDASQGVVRPRGQLDAGDYLFSWLRKNATIGTVIDIGANDGAFLAFLQQFFAAQKSFAFEPMPDARQSIEARNIPGVTIFPHALSDYNGTTTFEVNSYHPASSMLPVSELSRREFPQTSAIVQRIETPVARLDDVLSPEAITGKLFVKMDVQGVEDKVIAGGRRTIGLADYVLVEVSFRPMYQGQALFEEVHAPLAALGLRLAGVKNQVCAESGEPLFAHFLYRAERLLQHG
jgi:FkbM family methyltransferase